MEEHCCFIDPANGLGCEKPAQWAIYSGPTEADTTCACTEHAGYLLTDAPVQYIYLLSIPDASDCALHNAPAYPIEPCDCGVVVRRPYNEVEIRV